MRWELPWLINISIELDQVKLSCYPWFSSYEIALRGYFINDADECFHAPSFHLFIFHSIVFKSCWLLKTDLVLEMIYRVSKRSVQCYTTDSCIDSWFDQIHIGLKIYMSSRQVFSINCIRMSFFEGLYRKKLAILDIGKFGWIGLVLIQKSMVKCYTKVYDINKSVH